MESLVYSEYNEQFQAFAIFVLILLIIESLVSTAQNPYLNRIRIFNRKRKTIATMLLIAVSLTASAQNDRNNIRLGNREYRGGNAAKAEVAYRKALASNPENAQAIYNLGCALQQQQKDSAAVVQFEKSAKLEKSPLRRAMSYHNIGTICQKKQLYDDAINAYKQALRLNPSDNETRYNLELCKKLKKDDDQQNNQNNQNKNNQNNNDDKDKQDKKDQQDKKDEQNKDKQDNKDQQKQQQQQQEQMSKENAEQMLQAAMQNEKQTQQRMKKAMQQQQRRNLQKNW